ncbi:MAG: DUF2207 domain-containing protein [Nanoarchaeota archaeon]|nr:DUF2207 domain-containing protein [Nanoarchaeota archaeon]
MKKKLVLLLLLLSFSTVFAKSFFIKSADVQVNVADDGLVSVREELTFHFDGCYSVIYREIPLFSESDIISFQGSSSEVFTESRERQSDYYIYEFYFRDYQCDKETTVVMDYTMDKVVDVYDDISSLHFQFWGADWERLTTLTATITLPSDVREYWIHNQVTGNVYNSTGNVIYYTANGVPANHWIEAQATFAPLSETRYADVHEGTQADEIKAMETYYAVKQFMEIFFAIIFVIWPPVLFWIVYNKYGRELVVEYMGVYERNPPTSDSPAIVSAILNSHNDGKPILEAFIATMFDLARMKILSFKGDEKNVIIQIHNDKKDAIQLTDYEDKVLTFLFKYAEKDNTVNWNSMKKKLQSYSDSESFQKTIKSFKEAVSETFKKEDYFIDKGNKEFLKWSAILTIISIVTLLTTNLANLFIVFPLLIYLPFIIVSFLVSRKNLIVGIFINGFLLIHMIGLMGGISLAFGSIISTAFIISFITVVVLNLISRKVLGKWTQKGRNFELKWNNFKKFLKDYSLLKEHPPQSIIMWEQFLVYAIILGVADNVIKVMKLQVPDFAKNSNMAVLYYHPHFYSSLHSTMMSSSVRSRSSGGRSGFGGGGGGFGGGHGGGGGGAR